jgi:hypothetical protein
MELVNLASTALVVVLTLVAVFATSARAAPELLGTVPNSFIATGGAGKLSTTGGNNIECTSNGASGELTSATEGKLTARFQGCTKGCKTEGAAAKEVVWNTVKGSIVLIKESPTDTYGVLDSNVNIEILCTGLTVTKKGSIIGVSTLKRGVLTLTATVSTTESAQGVQAVKICEEPTICSEKSFHLEINFGTGFEEAALVGTDSVTFEKEVEPVG